MTPSLTPVQPSSQISGIQSAEIAAVSQSQSWTVRADSSHVSVRKIPTRTTVGANFRHGQAANSSRSGEYKAWQGMWERCTNSNNKCFKNYGGRGISVCERWSVFVIFFSDMGPRPPGYSIDRIDVNGNYEPSNCRWASSYIQSRNRRTTRFITAFGETKPMVDWGKDQRCVVPLGTLHSRLARGMPTEAAMTTPASMQKKSSGRVSARDSARMRELRAEGMTYSQISEATGVTYFTAYRHSRHVNQAPTQSPPHLPCASLNAYLADLALVDDSQEFFSAMGRIHAQRGINA